MRDVARPRQLENVEVPDQVRLDIGARILDRVANTGLRAEMNDAIELLSVERLPERRMIGEIALEHG